MTATIPRAQASVQEAPPKGRIADVLRYYSMPGIFAVAITGFLIGGPWAWLGAALFVPITVLDTLLPPDFRQRRIGVPRWVMDIPLWMVVGLAFVLMGLFLVGLNDWHDGGDTSGWAVLGMAITITLTNVVPGVTVYHELLHRRHGFPIAVSKVMLSFLLDANRDVAHRITHHVELNTPADPDTPYRGQTMYSFIWTATIGALKDSLVGSYRSLRKRELSLFHYRNAAYSEFGMLAIFLALGWLAASWQGSLIVFAVLCASKAVLEGINFLQHYGLVRVPGSSIRLHHAWNHQGYLIRPLGCEISTHIHHHFDTQHRYFELKPEPDAPQMPSALFCFVLCWIPPLWTNKIAKPKLREWDEKWASPAEQRLAMEANRRAGWPIWIDLPDQPKASASDNLAGAGR